MAHIDIFPLASESHIARADQEKQGEVVYLSVLGYLPSPGACFAHEVHFSGPRDGHFLEMTPWT